MNMFEERTLEIKNAERHDVKSAEDYIVYRIKELEDENVALSTHNQLALGRCDELERQLDKQHEEYTTLKNDFTHVREEMVKDKDFKRGLATLIKMFGWKPKKITDKKYNTKYYLVDKNKKQIEVEWVVFFAVSMINQER